MAAPDAPGDRVEQDPASYWGYLFNRDKTPTDRLDRLLRGIAWCISSNLHRTDNHDLAPTQLAAFYKMVGGDYDPLFLGMPASSIAFIYKNLGCAHSLQPDPEQSGYTSPCVPALKPRGFVTWQSIQLLLGPEEHVPFMQNALKAFEVVDPIDGKPFPRILPKEAFPDKPDPTMVNWHEGVSERLRIEAQEAQQQSLVSTVSTDVSSDERGHAAAYFSNPHYRNKEGRPAIVRHVSKAPSMVLHGGKVVARNVRDILDPNLFAKRRPTPERQHSGERGDHHRRLEGFSDAHTPTHAHSSHRHHNPPPRVSRRSPSPSVSSDDDDGRRARRHSSHQVAVRRSSHEPAHSPRDHSGHSSLRNRSSSQRRSTSSGRRRPEQQTENFNPSTSPPFAARVTSAPQQQQPIHPHLYNHPSVNFATPPGSRSHSRPASTADSRPSSLYSNGRPRSGTFQVAASRRDSSFTTEEHVRRESMPVPPTGTDRGDASRARRGSPHAPAPLVGGVGGRAYPNETPWR